jgi:hypothetical protein
MYILLNIEPPSSVAGMWTFGTLMIAFLVLAIWFIVHGGKKEEESMEAQQEREKADLRVVHKEVEPNKKVVSLDEHENAIGGDYPSVGNNQSN